MGIAIALLALTASSAQAAKPPRTSPWGTLEISVTHTGPDKSSSKIPNVKLELAQPGSSVAPIRLITEDDGVAIAYLEPGKYLLKTRVPIQRDGKSYTWRGNVEVFPGKNTRLPLSNDNADVEPAGSPQAAEPDDPAPIEPTADMVLPKLVHKEEPVFPPKLAFANAAGTVVMLLVIDEQGVVIRPTILRSTDVRFNLAALDAARQQRYTPALKDGKPVAVYYTWKVSFNTREEGR